MPAAAKTAVKTVITVLKSRKIASKMPKIEKEILWAGKDTICVKAKASIIAADTIDKRLISGKDCLSDMAPFYHAQNIFKLLPERS